MTDAEIDAEHAAAVADAPPPCKCGHAATHHSRSHHSIHAGKCWHGACGCTQLRPKEQDQ